MSEDSDATVAEGTLSDCCSDAEGVRSPSLLHITSMASVTDTDEIIPSSDVDGYVSGDDDETMSQEFPPPMTRVAQASSTNSEAQDSHNSRAEKESKSPPPLNQGKAGLPTLNEVSKEQATLLANLKSAEDNRVDATTVKYLQTSVTAVEQQLKTISAANQRDRKALAASHASLHKHQGCSKEDVAQRSQSIREKLLDLASKQKRLLQCFVIQKEIASRLNKLLEQWKDAEQHNTGTSGSGRARSSTLPPVHGLPPSVSAALPDLARHLRATSGGASGSLNSADTQSGLQITSSNSSDKTARLSKTNQQSSKISNQIRGITPGLFQLAEHHSLPAPSLSPLRQVSTRLTAANTPTATTTTDTAVTTTIQATGPKLPPLIQQPDPTWSTKSTSQGELLQSQEAGKLPPDLAQPVPLDILIRHGFILPGGDCISCSLMGCEFKASLLEDGSLQSAAPTGSTRFQQPHEWLNSCWATLGHQKKLKRSKQAYKAVLYRGVPLIQFCEKYSLKQVSSYLSQKQDADTEKQKSTTSVPTRNTAPSCTEPMDTGLGNDALATDFPCPPSTAPAKVALPVKKLAFSVHSILSCGQVFLVHSTPGASLTLPNGFWDGNDMWLTPELQQQMELDLKW